MKFTYVVRGWRHTQSDCRTLVHPRIQSHVSWELPSVSWSHGWRRGACVGPMLDLSSPGHGQHWGRQPCGEPALPSSTTCITHAQTPHSQTLTNIYPENIQSNMSQMTIVWSDNVGLWLTSWRDDKHYPINIVIRTIGQYIIIRHIYRMNKHGIRDVLTKWGKVWINLERQGQGPIN